MSGALDSFFGHYYHRRPVNATFTGIHLYDSTLPDWSPSGLEALEDEMHGLARDLGAAHPLPATAQSLRDNVDLLDAELARAFLEIQLAENASGHGIQRNPSLWTREAIFSIVALTTRDFAPAAERARSMRARLEAIPTFLGWAQATIGGEPIPEAWTERAIRECDGGRILLDRGVAQWLTSASLDARAADAILTAARRASQALGDFDGWLRSRRSASDTTIASGAALFDVLLARGHQCAPARAQLLIQAREQFADERALLAEQSREVAGSWSAAQAQLANDHPTVDDYLGAFERTWTGCRERAALHDVVTWPVWPIRFVQFPAHLAEAAPYLDVPNYRSPAPFDDGDGFHDYLVPPIPGDAAAATAHLRAWNHAVIKLDHVVPRGAIGHHLQNWHAYHSARSRIGKIAAVNCANRIGMFPGGSMAAGWACYAETLMEELEFLSPLEQLASRHARVRHLGRAIVDIELHQGTMSFDEAVQFNADSIGMSREAAHAEALTCSMFPCSAITYWLGSREILDLRNTMRARRGNEFSLKGFHDELLGYGSIPAPLASRLMIAGAA